MIPLLQAQLHASLFSKFTSEQHLKVLEETVILLLENYQVLKFQFLMNCQ